MTAPCPPSSPLPLRAVALALAAIAAGTVLWAARPAAPPPGASGTAAAWPQAAARTAAADGRMAWWREARFGMFIHWGLYAIPAGEWKGQTSYAEWIMNAAQIPVARYERFRDQFNPVKFDADAWVRTAKDAGVRYIVITTKHHDGFALFDSAVSDYDVMATPFHRDIMKELLEACRRGGLRIGWYHSIMDWHHPDYLPRRPWETRSAEGADFDRYVAYLKSQVRELLTNYGPVDVMWFDGQWEGTWTHERGLDLYRYVRGLQPSIIVNNRVDKGGGQYQLTKDASFAGDFGTPEQEVPPTGLPGVDWETCMTMNDHWGYNSHDTNWKSVPALIRTLADVASKGGNLLLNVGPTAEGLLPPASVERLHAMGAWLKTNGESIYGTSASPFPALPWGRATQRPREGEVTRLYLHVFDWPADGRLVVDGLFNEVRGAFLLSAPATPLAAGREVSAVVVRVPREAPDASDSVVVLDVAGRPDVALPPSIAAPAPIFIDRLAVTVASPRERIELRYTTDGSDPVASSRLVTGPIQLDRTTTVTARAFRDGQAVSPAARATYTKVAPHTAETLASSAPGLRYEYFEGTFDRTTDFDAQAAEKTGTVSTFDLSPRARNVRFGFRFRGYLVVPADGVYEFALTSDDGSRLLVDGEVVVDNDGLHSLAEKIGVAALAAGLHRLQLDFFERDGGYDLKVHWSGPDIPKQPITERDVRIGRGQFSVPSSQFPVPSSQFPVPSSEPAARGLRHRSGRW